MAGAPEPDPIQPVGNCNCFWSPDGREPSGCCPTHGSN